MIIDHSTHKLQAIIEAWERLPGGHYTPQQIERWLQRDMAPAINAARADAAREVSREQIARIIYDANPDVEGSQFSGPYQRTFDDACSRGYPKARSALKQADAILALGLSTSPALSWPDDAQFPLGATVQKKGRSKWRGKIVGWYRTDLTALGYAVESSFEEGSVQIYPESALLPWTSPAPSDDVGRLREALEEIVALCGTARQPIPDPRAADVVARKALAASPAPLTNAARDG